MNTQDQEFLVQRIRSQYTEKEYTALDELRALDAKVKKPALVTAVVLGCISAVVMGAGMSLVMTDIGAMLGIGNAMLYGILVGIVGLVGALVNYPLYKAILGSRKAKYADRILALSEKLLEEA